ncbi:MAG TPA: hypothetical protein VF698_08405 [Thermoanaerobaculia bacterium]|jgi:hypothetical protein
MWKLLYRLGLLRTPFRHFTASAKGTKNGQATVMSMNTWAPSKEVSADMLAVIGRELGFTVAGDVDVRENGDPYEAPPKKNPSAYGVTYIPG